MAVFSKCHGTGVQDCDRATLETWYSLPKFKIEF